MDSQETHTEECTLVMRICLLRPPPKPPKRQGIYSKEREEAFEFDKGRGKTKIPTENNGLGWCTAQFENHLVFHRKMLKSKP